MMVFSFRPRSRAGLPRQPLRGRRIRIRTTEAGYLELRFRTKSISGLFSSWGSFQGVQPQPAIS